MESEKTKSLKNAYDIFQRLFYLLAFVATTRSLFTPKGRWNQLGFLYVIFLNLWNVTSFGFFATQLPDLIQEKNTPRNKVLFYLTVSTHFLMLGATVWSTISSTNDFLKNKHTFLNSDITLGDDAALFCNSFSYFLSMAIMTFNSYCDYPQTKSDQALDEDQLNSLKKYRATADGTCSASSLCSAFSVYFEQKEMLVLSTLLCATTTMMNMAVVVNRYLHREMDAAGADVELTGKFSFSNNNDIEQPLLRDANNIKGCGLLKALARGIQIPYEAALRWSKCG